MRLLIIQHVTCEGLGLLESELISKGWGLDIRCMDLPGGALPDHLDKYRALIILGGPMGANEGEKYPYLFKVQELVREAAAKQIPCVGICLGAQLIARALGAKVMPNPVKEIGWLPVRLLPAGMNNRLFKDMPSGFSVFQWHSDTFVLPEGAKLLAEGGDCRNQAFVYGDHIWALQFHLEVTPAMIAVWSELYKDELADYGGPGVKERLIINTRARWEIMQSTREQFFSNLNMILENRNKPE
ncbi:MAG TPA: type 1 glutamine amidotransferase [Syntrophomonadaceae bacterium]|nr:type 1 glutamine amidotransferase [Syntrophomonadaceae bacterium]HNX29274.1 type 1 glutamine amidotransferase [Syntrophomonadaceae bacterium]HPR94084.1 type 1 glutamine amidotransferase [Syntrophomonadaceae bacterium]